MSDDEEQPSSEEPKRDSSESSPPSESPQPDPKDDEKPGRAASGLRFVLPPDAFGRVVDLGRIRSALMPAVNRHRLLGEAVSRSLLPAVRVQRFLLPDIARPALAAQRVQMNQSLLPLIAAQQTWAKQFSQTSLGLEKVFATLPKFDFAGLDHLVKALREALPPNWPEDLDSELLHEAVYEHGLPVAWVPRAEILDEMLAASNRVERLAVLASHREAVLDDCMTALEDVTHDRLASQVPLALAAANALRAGHTEAGQALACVVADTAIRHFLGRDYGDVKDLVKVDLNEIGALELRQAVALAPVHVFLTTWYPSSGKPAPLALSRHVTIHQADREHLHADNALVAVMLVCSLLRTFQEMASAADVAAA